MRILITNDDGVFAPGIAALARGLHAAFGDEHELVVVAPLTDHSGAGAAVGPVYERESIPYEHVDIPGLADVPTYGIDGSPALSVILACIVGFGPKPRDYSKKINAKVKALAFSRALFDRVSAGEISVIEAFAATPAKTKAVNEVVGRIAPSGKILLVDAPFAPDTARSARNIGRVTLQEAAKLNTFDLVQYQRIIVSSKAIEAIIARVNGGKN